jgi:transcriptional regulator with XRE-family HTH domain
VAEDWAAVAVAINQRMTELDLSQRELVERSILSRTAVQEIRHNVRQRHRSARTLEALSVALAWHPQHLAAILNGLAPPKMGEPMVTSDRDVPGRLAVIEHRLREIADLLGGIDVINGQLDQIRADLSAIIRKNGTR